MRVGYVAADYSSWSEEFPGGVRKVQGQLAAMRRAGFEVELLTLDSGKRKPTAAGKRFLFIAKGYSWSSVDVNQFDVLYIRRPGFVRRSFLKFLRDAKEKNPNLIILYEIPTYPYDKEYKVAAQLPALVLDRMNREKLARHVDRIVDLSGHAEIFDVPTIQMINGIDLTGVRSRRPSLHEGTMHIACAAAFSEWHGVDRLVEGLACYYGDRGGKRDIRVHLMGEGPELKGLKEKVLEYDLGEHVTFYGVCGKEEMDEVYDACTMAIASLGLHRIGLTVASTLKTREYLAKGMPFVYSGEIDVFNEDPVDFCLRVPADESFIDIDGLVAFHDSLYERESEDRLIERIRRYAESHVSMEKAMKGVVDYIKKGRGDIHEQ